MEDFLSIETLIQHLNSEPTCWPSKAQPQEVPVPPVFCRCGSDQMPATGTFHPQSGYIFGVSRNKLDRLDGDPYAYWQKISHYYPFHDEGEWELGKFLVENLTQTQIIKFLKLKWFNNHARPSFTTKDQLLDWMDSLPCFTEWKVSKMEFTGYKTVHPIELIWRDALDVIKQLFSDPIFANHTPHVVNVGDQCECGDYMSANMAWRIQDHLPIEASMITTVTKNASPVTMAVQADFGNGILHPPHTGKHTLQQITNISRNVDPWGLDKFQKAAKSVNLSGVHMPYWRDWIYECPSIFLAEAVGAYELDNHFITQHKRVGTCHFAKGVTHVKQMTGHEYRDIQHTIVASIAGATSPQFVHAIRAIVEFIYLAQNPVHSPETLQSMEQALSDFHSFKGTIIEAEARKGKKGVKENFFIPKLELLQSFKGTVQWLSTLMQFSADITECLLITHCKDLFPWMAWQSKDFTEQCMQILNRQEAMEIFDLYALMTSRGVPLVNAMHAEEDKVETINPTLSWVSHVLPDEVDSWSPTSPKPPSEGHPLWRCANHFSSERHTRLQIAVAD
ncbi:uncharacterized protein EDB93DRAFT_1251891 [Suillus bovinus]|uniref:uncharacterized protein n=1 Tax=Suillus bovinus TaxID=48563 RepID=UPI001B85B442|nr:uncharacterized protein EDB93DRAFT_1251891 [Suillus bovinus]KAG2143841.1 hypothetical protein EDB93DRAFT_1251891 [Suillus bovinus]